MTAPVARPFADYLHTGGRELYRLESEKNAARTRLQQIDEGSTLSNLARAEHGFIQMLLARPPLASAQGEVRLKFKASPAAPHEPPLSSRKVLRLK
jgi:hypothetical protein